MKRRATKATKPRGTGRPNQSTPKQGELRAERSAMVEAIAATALGHLCVPLESVLAPAIDVICKPLDDDSDALIGSSRFGGLPDLPAGSEWPAVDGIPLEFIGQIALTDLRAFEAAKELPPTGLLSFFFDGMLTGYDRGEGKDRGRVILSSSSASLVRLAPPKPRPKQFQVYPSATPRFASAWTLPHFEEIDGDECPTVPAVVPIIRTAEEREAYHALRRTVRGKYIRSHLLGHADDVQGGEIRFVALRSQDHDQLFRYVDYEWTNAEQLASELRELRLLFQASSGGGSEAWSGGAGVLYFWIRRADLENVRFERAFALMQAD